MRKRISLFLAFLFLFTLTFSQIPVYAADRDYDYKTGQTFKWAPKNNSLQVDERIGLYKLDYKITWDTTGANLVNNQLGGANFWDYFTMEARDTTENDLSGTSGYTNLPTGTWQVEDDNNDYLYEEVEYYWANPGLQANYSYTFRPEFIKSHSSGSAYIHLMAQKGPLHQGYDWDFLRQDYLRWSNSGISSFEEDASAELYPNDEVDMYYNQEKKVYIKQDSSTIRATKFLSPAVNLEEVKAEQRNILTQLNDLNLYPVTLTFKPNTKLNEVNQLLMENSLIGGTIKYQAIQADGIIGSGFFANTERGYASFKETCKEYNLENIVIIGYIGEANKKTINTFMDTESIALTDISKELLERELKAEYPNKKINVYVPEQYVTIYQTKK